MGQIGRPSQNTQLGPERHEKYQRDGIVIRQGGYFEIKEDWKKGEQFVGHLKGEVENRDPEHWGALGEKNGADWGDLGEGLAGGPAGGGEH